MPNGAQIIVRALEEAGVEVAFGLPGVHNLALWEALRGSRVRLVGVRHEQAAVYAADGYARATGRFGVAITTTGPGAANTLGAVGEAWASRSQVLVIATDIPSKLRRPDVYSGVLHETTDQAAMFAPVVGAVHVCGDVGMTAAAALADLIIDRPVYLQVPTDLLSAPAEPAELHLPGRRMPDYSARLPDAERPLLWVGRGAVAWDEPVAEFAEQLGAPVIETYGARGLLPRDHPSRVGLPPHVEPVGRLWDEADLVIAVGDPLDGMTTQNWLQPQPPCLITVGETTPNYEVHHEHSSLHNLVAGEPGEPWADLDRVRREACEQLDERALEFLDAIAFGLPEDANVVCDMCIPGYWIAAFHPFGAPRRLQYPVGWGTLGFAFPASLGAALAGTGPTVAICGDGGFLFACGELATVAQEQIPLTTVIVDDGGYGMLRYDQDQAGTERFGVDLRTPDFDAMARAFGIEAETVTGLDQEFGEALARHVASPAPSVLVAKAQALVPPPSTSPNWYRKRGFA